MTIRFITIGFLLLVGCNEPASPPPPPALVEPLVFGLATPLGGDGHHNAARLVGDFFSEALKRPVQVRALGYDELVSALAQGEVDIAAVTPLTYVKASKRIDVTIVRKAVYHHQLSYMSVLFVRKDSPFTKLSDLEHRKIAWVQRGSASGSLVPRSLLRQQDLDPSKFFAEERFMPDHGQVCQAVADGTVDVGASFAALPTGKLDEAVVDGCENALGADGLKGLRVLTWGDSIPNDVIIARNGLSADVVSRLGAVLDGLPGSPEGLLVMHDGLHADGYAPGEEADFTTLRQLMLRYPEDG